MRKASALAKDNAKVVEELPVAAQAKTKTIGEKVVDNAVANTEAAFAAAQPIAHAKTLPEAARLRIETDAEAAGGCRHPDQGPLRDELKAALDKTYAALNAAATKSFAQLKKTADFGRSFDDEPGARQHLAAPGCL